VVIIEAAPLCSDVNGVDNNMYYACGIYVYLVPVYAVCTAQVISKTVEG